MEALDYKTQPVEIAENIYWVGHVIPDDFFQCHVYLIKDKDGSVLIDPGSVLTYEETLKKIKQIIDPKDIKYMICHHQDPDIVSSIQYLLKEFGSGDKYLITHWRAWALLKHYNWKVKVYEIEENDFLLKLSDRVLRFIPTPYLHFPGAFCTIDEKTRTLFSSDIFGAFTEKFELFAKDVDDYFEKMKPFHEHYMPDNSILNYGMDNIEKHYPIKLIAPQHGSIIREELIRPLIKKLRELKCGLFKEYNYTRDILKLSKLNEMFDEVLKIISSQDRFFVVVNKILSSMRAFYPIHSIKSFTLNEYGNKVIVMDSDKEFIELIDDEYLATQLIEQGSLLEEGIIDDDGSSDISKLFKITQPSYIFPVKAGQNRYYGVCFIILEKEASIESKDLQIIRKFELPICMAVLNERRAFCLEEKNRILKEESITDQLTGLFNRKCMKMYVENEFEECRAQNKPFSAIMIDIDSFKHINDTFSHQAGDLVIKRVAEIIRETIRSRDIPIRYGGEEFLLLLPDTNKEEAKVVAERVRKQVESSEVIFEGNRITFTISAGVASTEDSIENVRQLILLSDKRMYKAKRNGGNRVFKA